MTDDDPTIEMARAIARRVAGREADAIRRFATGAQHFVFEASFAEAPSIVVRLSRARDRELAKGAFFLSRQLRPLGVPLPAVLAADVDAPQPYLVLERLPGRDLGEVIDGLSTARLAVIAKAVAAAQALVAGTPSAGRYGYAVRPEEAILPSWSAVLRQSLERSRSRLLAAGLFDAAPLAAAASMLEQLREVADSQAPTPFLHDTTTKNVIVGDDGAFSGIVDVDDLCFGDPRWAVALTLASLLVAGGPADYAMGWLAVAGHADDRLFRLYVALFLLDLMGEHGQVFNGNERPSAPAARQKLLELFAVQLRRAGA